jgi:DNA end-binding protein Ku
MIRPIEGGLVMQQLLYAGEVRAIGDIDIAPGEVKDAELKLAQQLIESQAVDTFDPKPYVDDVRTRIEAAIQKKVEGQEITMAEAPESGGQVIDLMEALRASLERKTPARTAAREPEPEAARPQAVAASAGRKPPKRAQESGRAHESGSTAKKSAKK